MMGMFGQQQNWHPAVCDVCRLLDGDTSLKLCFYCRFCDSEICQRDVNNLPRRAQAKFLRMWEKPWLTS